MELPLKGLAKNILSVNLSDPINGSVSCKVKDASEPLMNISLNSSYKLSCSAWKTD